MEKATAKMIEFAKKIAERLHIEEEEPDYNDYDETSEFIDEYKDEYYNSLNGRD